MTSKKTVDNQKKKIRTLPVLIFVQLVIAILTVTITILVGLKIKPLIDKKVELENTVVDLQDTINKLETQIKETMIFDRNRYQLDWERAKLLFTYARKEKQQMVIMDIIDMKNSNVGWNLYGRSPDVGFNSPSFAAYLLSKNNLLEIDPARTDKLSELLNEKLPETNNPQIGDLIFYESGFTMFYFKDTEGHPFCIGMTPLGIVALEINFGPRLIRYGKVNY